MRTTEYGEICISIDNQTSAERAFKRNGKMGKESKVAERQREIECVCASVDRNINLNRQSRLRWKGQTH